MTLRLYDYVASANCYKVRLLLAQLGREYERVPVDIFDGETLTQEFAEKNRGLTTPVLEIAPGQFLPESAAILLYLAAGTEFLPSDPAELGQVHQWLFFEQANLMQQIGGLRFGVITGRIDPKSDEAISRRGLVMAVVGAADAHLAEREFFAAGRYTIADIALYGYLDVAHEAGVDMAPFANVNAWRERVRSQPGHMDDLEPYPDNAWPGRSNSIYDLLGII
ncbi:MAG TPA: glutathione S-transferase family protein [Thermoleophilaceae bacterium]